MALVNVPDSTRVRLPVSSGTTSALGSKVEAEASVEPESFRSPMIVLGGEILELGSPRRTENGVPPVLSKSLDDP